MADTANNPLRQYFRRPALYLKLPSNGVGYSQGAIEFPENRELPVYPMTAIDEITSRTPDALYNGLAVTEIIKSCVPSIKRPWEILNVDLDPILVAIRMATNGQMMELETVCPKCEESSKFDLNLSGVLASFKPGDYNSLLDIDEFIQVKFQPLNYKQINGAGESQFEIQRMLNQVDSIEDAEERNKKTSAILTTINEMALDLMIDTIEYIKTPDSTVLDKNFIREFLTNCDKNTYNKIRDTNVELRKSTELKPLEIKCLHCSNEYTQPFNINISNFFE
jgi:hypothetical protein